MGEENQVLNLAAQPPAVVLMAGLQGAGKTTSVGKLGKFLREKHKKKVLVVSADVYRPAAIKQLETLAEQVGVDFFPSDVAQKPVDIVNAALKEAKLKFYDVLLVDTAGRLHVDEAMMDEIKQVHASINPVETLFVVDAMTGQDAANTAKAFNEALPLTGVVLTKSTVMPAAVRRFLFVISPVSRSSSSAWARKPKRWSRSTRTVSPPVSSAWATCCR